MWLFTVPVAVALPLFVGAFVALSLLVVVLLRRWVPRDGDAMDEWDRVLRYVMAAYGVLYGVTLALIAAASYENFRDGGADRAAGDHVGGGALPRRVGPSRARGV